MGEMKFLSNEGDTKISWNPEKEKEVSIAKDKFDELLKKGFIAFRVDDKGKKTSRRIYEFLPYAGTILLIPPIAGG